jgi:hypothetical protein
MDRQTDEVGVQAVHEGVGGRIDTGVARVNRRERHAHGWAQQGGPNVSQTLNPKQQGGPNMSRTLNSKQQGGPNVNRTGHKNTLAPRQPE